MDGCLEVFPAMDTELDPLLSSPDFLAFLNDVSGPLPTIPDTCAPSSPEVTSSLTAAQPAQLQTVILPPPQLPVVTSTTPLAVAPFSSAGLQSALQLGGAVLQQPQQVPQMVLQLQPSRAMSTSSSDASGRMFATSAPGSPVSSRPTSSSDISSLPVQNPLFSISAAVGGPVAKRPRHLNQDISAAASQQQELPPPQQQQKPLTKQQIAANKRRAPEVDWRAIDDPAERRRQRRLAKNRVTAARSRERKKEQLVGMEGRMQSLEQENAQMRALLASLTQENASLKEQLASLARGAAAVNTGSSPEPAVLKCLAIMHLVACLTLTVKASFGLVMMLVSVLVQQSLQTGTSPAAVLSKSSSMSAAAVASAPFASAKCEWQGVFGGRRRWQQVCTSSGAVTRPRLRSCCGSAAGRSGTKWRCGVQLPAAVVC